MNVKTVLIKLPEEGSDICIYALSLVVHGDVTPEIATYRYHSVRKRSVSFRWKGVTHTCNVRFVVLSPRNPYVRTFSFFRSSMKPPINDYVCPACFKYE